MTQTTIDLDPTRLLTLIHTLLNKVFFDVSRDESKELYRTLDAGEEVPFMTFETRGGSTFACRLALDSSGYDGRLNFASFRAALAAHLHSIADTLENNRPVNLYTSEATYDVIFHHPGVIKEGKKINVLVTAMEQREPDKLCIRLLFLDPAELDKAMNRTPDDGKDAR